ncbi:MAG TPA: diguanylate cyclase, partial [Negativicutes bacterium]|nr:diguanylate cyclase [Negativicutes bacterium]
MKKKITTKMVRWILGGTLMAFVMFNMANYYFASKTYSERIIRENQIHTRNVAFGVASFYETAYRVVGEMAQAQEIKSMDALRQQSFINDRFSQHGFFDNMVIQRVPDGVQTARVRGEKAARPDRWWFQKIQGDKRPFVSPSFYSFGVDSSAPTTVTGVFFPVMQGDVVVSVFAAFLRVDGVQERVGQHYRGDDRYTYILDEDGVVVAHPEWEKVKLQHNYKNGDRIAVARDNKGEVLLEGQDYRLEHEKIEISSGLQQIVKQVLAGESGTTEYIDTNGDTMLCSYTPVKMPGYGAAWAAVTVQDKTIAMLDLQKTTGRNAALSFVVLAGLAAIILRQSREREKGAQRLEQMNAALEEEVSERTRAETELTASNEELTAMNEEMIAVTDTLQRTNQQLVDEVQVRQEAEGKLRLRERQYHAMTRLIADNNAEVDAQMQSMLDSGLELVEATDGYIVLMETGHAMIRYVRGNRNMLLGKELTMETGLLSTVLATGNLQYVEDYQNFSKRRRGTLWDDQRTAVIFPLKREEKVVGALAITWKTNIRPLLADEIEMLQQFADLASLALQGSKLRGELKRELVQREMLHEKISHMAYHDTLTGLPNRASLTERLKVELEAVSQGDGGGVVFFIDLDDLKSINDNFGHSAGDRLIVAAGKKIQAIVGEKGFVARLGGDEFIIVLSERLEVSEIARLGDYLVDGLCREYPITEEAARVSA